jgi:peptidoglycan glycosyltransferase
VLLDVSSGEVLTLVSRPTYDANTLDDDWEVLEADPAAPLLNRATQGLYQPGGVLQLVVLATALEADAVRLDAPVSDATALVTINGQSLGCAQALLGSTWADAIAAACPAPLADLGETLGSKALEAAFHAWGLDVPPSLEIPTEAGELPVTDPRLAAVGQETLTVTPLHMALVVATIGSGGVMPPAHLVLETEAATGRWQASNPPGRSVQLISAALAQRLSTLLRPSEDGRVLGHSSFAAAGAERPFHVWFLGLAPAQAPRYAVVVLLEHAGSSGLAVAAKIGHDSLLAALGQTP